MRATAKELIEAVWPDGSPTRVLRCRHCGRKNELQIARAVTAMEACKCGVCGDNLFLARDEPLTDLAADAYQHSLDRGSLDALKAMPGFGRLTKWLLRQTGDRTFRVLNMSSNIRCDEKAIVRC